LLRAARSCPLFEGLQRRQQPPRGVHVASCAECRLEVPVELEHVAEIVRTGETEAAIRFRGHRLLGSLASPSAKAIASLPSGPAFGSIPKWMKLSQ